MPNKWIALAALSLISAFALRPSAAEIITGINTVSPGKTSAANQSALIEELRKNGIKTVRIDLEEASLPYAIEAYKNGIGVVAILNPMKGSTAPQRPADPERGLTWKTQGLTGAAPQAFQDWFAPLLKSLDAAGVRVTAFELGNELNSANFNGDITETTHRTL